MAPHQTAGTLADLAPPGATELDRLKRRDRLAWSRLFEREHSLVYRFVLSRVGEPAVADDIAGQVFLEAIEGIGRYRDRGKPISAWLVTIARHRTLDFFRKRGRERGDGCNRKRERSEREGADGMSHAAGSPDARGAGA